MLLLCSGKTEFHHYKVKIKPTAYFHSTLILTFNVKATKLKFSKIRSLGTLFQLTLEVPTQIPLQNLKTYQMTEWSYGKTLCRSLVIIKKLCKSKKLVKSQSGHTEKPFADH